MENFIPNARNRKTLSMPSSPEEKAEIDFNIMEKNRLWICVSTTQNENPVDINFEFSRNEILTIISFLKLSID